MTNPPIPPGYQPPNYGNENFGQTIGSNPGVAVNKVGGNLNHQSPSNTTNVYVTPPMGNGMVSPVPIALNSDIGEKLNRSVVVLTSSNPIKADQFGIGFVIHRSGDYAFVVTTAEVIHDIGEDTICVNRCRGTLEKTGDHLSLDLAVVRVEDLPGRREDFLKLGQLKTAGCPFITTELQISAQKQRLSLKTCKGYVGNTLRISGADLPIQGIELFLENGMLALGYRGAPVVDMQTGEVFGVISYPQAWQQGFAIDIQELNRFWQYIDRHTLHQSLLQLGFEEQAELFSQAINRSPIGAYLIHGPDTKHGQKWLANRLWYQFVPDSINPKVFKVDLGRVGKENDIPALWRELAENLGCSLRSTPDQIANRVLRCWETRDVILSIYQVDCFSDELLNEFVRDFWLPLANKAQGLNIQGVQHRLLMFLIGYETIQPQPGLAITESFDTNSPYPIKSPENEAFSKKVFSRFFRDHQRLFQKATKNPSDITADRMYNESEGGIPQYAFIELCKPFGYDWKVESGREWCPIC